MKFRHQKGSLEESIKDIKEFSTIDEIKAHLNKHPCNLRNLVEEVKFKYAGFDERIGWNSFYVLQRIEGESRFTVAGISDGFLYS